MRGCFRILWRKEIWPKAHFLQGQGRSSSHVWTCLDASESHIVRVTPSSKNLEQQDLSDWKMLLVSWFLVTYILSTIITAKDRRHGSIQLRPQSYSLCRGSVSCAQGYSRTVLSGRIDRWSSICSVSPSSIWALQRYRNWLLSEHGLCLFVVSLVIMLNSTQNRLETWIVRGVEISPKLRV